MVKETMLLESYVQFTCYIVSFERPTWGFYLWLFTSYMVSKFFFFDISCPRNGTKEGSSSCPVCLFGKNIITLAITFDWQLIKMSHLTSILNETFSNTNANDLESLTMTFTIKITVLDLVSTNGIRVYKHIWTRWSQGVPGIRQETAEEGMGLQSDKIWEDWLRTS